MKYAHDLGLATLKRTEEALIRATEDLNEKRHTVDLAQFEANQAESNHQRRLEEHLRARQAYDECIDQTKEPA